MSQTQVHATVEADVHSLLLLLSSQQVLELWPGAQMVTGEPHAFDLTVTDHDDKPVLLHVSTSRPVTSQAVSLVGFTVTSESDPPFAGVFRVSQSRDRCELVLTLEHEGLPADRQARLTSRAQGHVEAIARTLRERAEAL
jgi:hypothetical protein